MKRYKMIVLTNAKPGRETDLNGWYVKQHVPDMLRITGFATAQLFQSVKAPDTPAAGFGYYVEFHMETDDLGATLVELKARQNTPLLPFTDASEPEFYFGVYEPITPVVTT
jgi:hypothetical protein